MSKTVIMTVDQVQSVSAALENQVSEMQKVINEVASAHSSLAMDDILSLENYSLKLHWGLLKASSSLKKQSERLEQLGSAAKTAASGIEAEDNGEGKVASSNGGKKSNNWVSWIGAAFPFTVPFTLAPFVAGLFNRNQGNNGSTSSDAYVLTEWNGKETVEKKSDEFHQYYEELEASHQQWEDTHKYEVYRNKVEDVSSKVPVGELQQNERYSDGSTGGLCTYSATTTLLRRKQAADGMDPSYQFDDVYRTNGGQIGRNADGTWPADSSYYFNRTYSKDGSSYTMSYINHGVSSQEMAEMLDQHPEGMMVWSPAGGYNHAVVVTDYTVDDSGNIHFFADDPVNDREVGAGRIPLSDTYLSSKNSDPIGTAAMIAFFE